MITGTNLFDRHSMDVKCDIIIKKKIVIINKLLWYKQHIKIWKTISVGVITSCQFQVHKKHSPYYVLV